MITNYPEAISEWLIRQGLAEDEYINFGAQDGSYESMKSAFRDPHPSRNTVFPTQAELDAIWIELEPALNLERQAELARESLRQTAKTSQTLIPVVKNFDDAFQSLRQSNTMTLANAYTAWRAIYAVQDSRVKKLIHDHTTPFTLPFDFNEPTNITDEYRVGFNTGIRSFLETVLNRIQI